MVFESSVTSQQVLSSMEVEVEDSHFCLRCRSTIVGLDQYILHRREKCQSMFPIKQSVNDQTRVHRLNIESAQQSGRTSPRSDPVLSSSSNHIEERLNLSVEVPIDDFMSHLGLIDIHSEEPLRADDFFSNLELQSCTKTQSKPLKFSANKSNQVKFDDLTTHDLDASRITDASSPIIPNTEGKQSFRNKVFVVCNTIVITSDIHSLRLAD